MKKLIIIFLLVITIAFCSNNLPLLTQGFPRLNGHFVAACFSNGRCDEGARWMIANAYCHWCPRGIPRNYFSSRRFKIRRKAMVPVLFHNGGIGWNPEPWRVRRIFTNISCACYK